MAEEVKNLAAQTSQATTVIAAQLAELVELVEDSIQVPTSVTRIDEVLDRVMSLQQTIAAAVEEQSAVIARSATSVAGATGELRESVEATAAAAHSAQEAIARARLWTNRLGIASRAQKPDLERLGQAYEPHALRKAVRAHTAWKGTLNTTISTGALPAGADLATVARDDACAFGQWLHSGEAAALDATRTSTVTDLHARFLRAAAQVLEAVANGDPAGARELMRNSDGYSGAAPYLMDALMDWLAAVER